MKLKVVARGGKTAKRARVIVKDFWCPDKKRNVSVTFAVKGRIFRKLQAVVDCPAIDDAGGTCTRRCLHVAEQRWPTRRISRPLGQWLGL